MLLSLFVSSQHVQNTSFCVGNAHQTSYTYTFLLYSHAVHTQTITQVLQNEHARALMDRRPPAEPSEASARQMEWRAASARRLQAHKVHSRWSDMHRKGQETVQGVSPIRCKGAGPWSGRRDPRCDMAGIQCDVMFWAHRVSGWGPSGVLGWSLWAAAHRVDRSSRGSRRRFRS